MAPPHGLPEQIGAGRTAPAMIGAAVAVSLVTGHARGGSSLSFACDRVFVSSSRASGEERRCAGERIGL
jgi:hypothetical protein